MQTFLSTASKKGYNLWRVTCVERKITKTANRCRWSSRKKSTTNLPSYWYFLCNKKKGREKGGEKKKKSQKIGNVPTDKDDGVVCRVKVKKKYRENKTTKVKFSRDMVK